MILYVLLESTNFDCLRLIRPITECDNIAIALLGHNAISIDSPFLITDSTFLLTDSPCSPPIHYALHQLTLFLTFSSRSPTDFAKSHCFSWLLSRQFGALLGFGFLSDLVRVLLWFRQFPKRASFSSAISVVPCVVVPLFSQFCSTGSLVLFLFYLCD
jgi:hypothetical protein